MNKKEICSIINGNLEAIDQGLRLIDSLSDSEYVTVLAPYCQSSIGQHFRHVADLYQAITIPASAGIVDYDRRRRGAAIENSRQIAIDELTTIKGFMTALLENAESLAAAEDSCTLMVKTEVSIGSSNSVTIKSSLMRELVFAGSHAVHHYALISIIAKLQGVELEERLGVAPATATFLREGDKSQTDAVCAR